MKYDYWYWNKPLSLQNIKAINKKIKTDSIVRKDNSASSTKTSKVKFIKYRTIKPYLENCIEDCYKINSQVFGYNLHYLNDDYVCCYNIYSKGSEYNWHIDSVRKDEEDVKFTILINLSEKKYTGGELQYWITEKPNTITELNQSGDMLMLRSFFLHKVTPITSGERTTLSLFLTGPKLQ
tara:strand:+ start:206 stop:745 length:540 start_codon:yes stop_codon:yes gene_type:complete